MAELDGNVVGFFSLLFTRWIWLRWKLEKDSIDFDQVDDWFTVGFKFSCSGICQPLFFRPRELPGGIPSLSSLGSLWFWREVQGRGIRGDICRFAATFARGQQVYFHGEDVRDSQVDHFQEAPGVPVHQVVSFADAFISEQSLERKLVAEVSWSPKKCLHWSASGPPASHPCCTFLPPQPTFPGQLGEEQEFWGVSAGSGQWLEGGEESWCTHFRILMIMQEMLQIY